MRRIPVPLARAANEPVGKEQLQKAGVRLARILDTAFGN
jgi:hypothetical protein